VIQTDNNKLSIISKNPVFKVLLHHIIDLVQNKSSKNLSKQALNAIFLLLDTLLHHNKEYFPFITANSHYQLLSKYAINEKLFASSEILNFLVGVIIREITTFSEYPITQDFFSYIQTNESENSISIRLLDALVQNKLIKGIATIQIFIDSFQIVEKIRDIVADELSQFFISENNKASEAFKLLYHALKSSKLVHLRFTGKLNGFNILIKESQKLLADATIEQSQKVINQLLSLSLSKSEQRPLELQDFENLMSKTKEMKHSYLIAHPQIFKDVYIKLLPTLPPLEKEKYYEFLEEFLDGNLYNSSKANSVELIEALYHSCGFTNPSSSEVLLLSHVMSMALKNIDLVPCLSTLRVLSNYLHLNLIEDAAANEPYYQVIKSHFATQGKKVFEAFLNSLTLKNKPAFNRLILSNQSHLSNYSSILIPRLSNFKTKQGLDAFTIFCSINLANLSDNHTLFLIYFEVEKISLKVSLQNKILVIQIDQLETLTDDKFSLHLDQKTSFYLGISFNLNLKNDQPGKIEISLNGQQYVSSLQITSLLFKNLYQIYGTLGDLQVLLGCWEDNKTAVVEYGSFMLFGNCLTKAEINNLYLALSANSGENWSWWNNLIDLDFNNLTIHNLLNIPLSSQFKNSIPYSSTSSFEEKLYKRISYKEILENLILFVNPLQIQRLDLTDNDLKKSLSNILKANILLSPEKTEQLLQQTNLCFLPNLYSPDCLTSSAILLENDFEDFKSTEQNVIKSLFNILPDSSLVDTLAICLLTSKASKSYLRTILRILMLLYQHSSRVKTYLDQKEYLKNFAGIFDSYNSNEELDDYFNILEGFMIKLVPDSSSQNWLLYSKNAFLKIFQGLDFLSRHEKYKSFGFRLIESKLLNSTNHFKRYLTFFSLIYFL